MIRTTALFSLALVAPLTAQITASATAHSRLDIALDSRSGSVPAGTTLVAPGSSSGRTMTVRDTNPICPASATSSVRPRFDPSGVALEFANKGQVGGLYCPSRQARIGPHSVLMTFAAARRVAGTLSIDTSAPRADATSYRIDVGADGTFEFESGSTNAAGRFRLPAVADAGAPVVVLVETSVQGWLGSRSYPPSLAMDVSVRFGEGERLPEYGTACGAPGTWGPPQFRGYDVRTATGWELHLFGEDRLNSNPPAVHFFVFGAQRLALRIPPTGCTLLTSLDILVPVMRNSAWRTALVLPIPDGVGPGRFYTQYLVGRDGPDLDSWYMSVGLVGTLH